jgi:hypothetical protein
MSQAFPDDLVIDDLRFTDLLRIALQDLPGASQGQWTLHGAVDPGITVLELIAWRLEQRLFMGEQVTDPVVRASLRLLGVADPHPTLPARTVLCFRPEPRPVTLPAGTVMSLADDALGRQFSLDGPVTVLPLGEVAVQGGMRSAGDRVDLSFASPGPRLASRLSLLVVVDAAPGVAPAWSRSAADVPPPAELRWTAVGPDGRESAVAVDDTTGGFRRSGLLHLDWPEAWNVVGPGACRLRATALRGRYTEAVRFDGVFPNAARASHRVVRDLDVTDQARRFLALPAQRLRIPGAHQQLADEPGAASLSMLEADGDRHTWTSVAAWVGTGPGDRVMLVDRLRGELLFGDGRAGRIPRPGGAAQATVSYAVGGGRVGNVGPGGSWVRDGGAEVAGNPVAADGGEDAETLDDAKERAADDLNLADRTVQDADTETLAVATPGVGLARAHVSLGFHPGFPCVAVAGAMTVTVVPHADRDQPSSGWTPAPLPDAGVLAAVRAHLEAGRLLGQEIFVRPPDYRRVTVWVTVSLTARSETIEGRVVDALRRFLDPLEGGSARAGWPFGGVVRPSALVGVVRTALGPEATVTALSVALDDGPPTDCDDLTLGPRELVWLAAAHITWVPSVPTGGGLQ